MKFKIFKIKALFYHLYFATREWKYECWDKLDGDLDSVVCCYPTYYSPCGCGAQTNKQYIEWNFMRINYEELFRVKK